ncbi:TPA: hypothetical protein ACRNCM_001598, partial [Pseudomonas aeruginosa]
VLQRKAGVWHVNTMGLWVGDDPYVDGKLAFDEYLKLPTSERIKVSRSSRGVNIIIDNKRYVNYIFSVSKRLFHVPKPVKIEGGRLVFPEHTGRGGGILTGYYLRSINSLIRGRMETVFFDK